MGKTKGKKDSAKKAEQRAEKAAKQLKKAEKKSDKKSKKDKNGNIELDELDQLLTEFKKADKKKTTVNETACTQPGQRTVRKN